MSFFLGRVGQGSILRQRKIGEEVGDFWRIYQEEEIIIRE